jgi:cystathionine beta-lyase/cystathionine gamma-synthase
MEPDERRAHGITERLIRLSVGLEAPDDLVRDLTAALDASRSAAE